MRRTTRDGRLTLIATEADKEADTDATSAISDQPNNDESRRRRTPHPGT